jgi:hypothetical protein
MTLIFSVRLEGCDPQRNRWRCYRVQVGHDLFGAWLVIVTFGRIGAPRGRTQTYVADDQADAQCIARACVRRRGSAPKRIGVAYVMRELVDPEGWISAETPSRVWVHTHERVRRASGYSSGLLVRHLEGDTAALNVDRHFEAEAAD